MTDHVSVSVTDFAEISASTFVDSVISSQDPWHQLNAVTQDEIRRSVVGDAVELHLNRCEPYRNYCDNLGYAGFDGVLEKIPLISTRSFKFDRILSVAPSEIEHWYTSSGTNGPKSAVPRDRITLERLIGSVHSGIELIGDWYDDDLLVFNLGSGDETTVWFQYVMSLIEVVFPTVYCEHNGLIDWIDVTARIEERLAARGDIAIVGPPFHVMALCDHIAGRGRLIKGNSRITVLTAGGWKRQSGLMVGKEVLRRQACEALGLTSANQLRDVFNQVELNTTFFECHQGRKHVPPWVYVATRDPRTMAARPDGDIGLLSYVDGSANSFPSMILSEDVGTVNASGCPCGVAGPTVDIQRRLNTTASRGCALAMEGIASE